MLAGLSLSSITDTATRFVENYGYVAIFIPNLVEGMGVPLPGETVLLFGGVMAHRGSLHMSAVIGVAATAAIIGDNTGYWLGRKGGRRFLNRYGRYIFLHPHRVDRAEAYFHAHGGKTVFLARWTAGLRILGAWTAGISHLSYPRFVLWNALGCITWAAGIGVLGYVLGASFEKGAKYLGFGAAVVIGSLLLAAVIVALRRRHRVEDAEMDELIVQEHLEELEAEQPSVMPDGD